jgi:excinuclease ABC subunit A
MAKAVFPTQAAIVIRGARQNNLKGIDLDLALNQLHVVTGPSGSGKSSLAFDTIYAEGQRRYVETFSPYTRQFLDRMDKPLVDEISGIPPAIAIEQANRVRTTRSTVGTMTEINDYLKLLMARVARGFCPNCHREIAPETPESIAEAVLQESSPAPALVTFGVPAPPGTKPKDFFQFLTQQGFFRVWLNRELVRIDSETSVKRLPAIVPVVQDRLQLTAENRVRLIEAIEQALRFGKGQLMIVRLDKFEEHRFSKGWHCPYCDLDIRPPSPGLFSFNNPLGACPACRGFGRTIGIDLDRAIPNRALSLAEGAIKPFQSSQMQECQRDLIKHALAQDVDIHLPFEELPESDQNWVINGDTRPDASAEEIWESGGWYGVRGFFDWMESRTYKMHVRVFLSRYRNYTLCPDCHGTRFKPEALNFRVRLDQRTFSLPELQQLPVEELVVQAALIRIPEGDSAMEVVRAQIVTRLRYLAEVGLGYLSLDRSTRSLSGGEIQRVNLTTCLGACLVNTLFVLDEPSVGLHPRDVEKLIGVLQGLRDKGNTLLVVEHDESVMHAADNLLELGPGRGEKGGELVFSGSLAAIQGAGKRSLTADYLTGKKKIPTPSRRRAPRRYLRVTKAREHNLKSIDVAFPLNSFVCVTGVSGSGKSTLVQNVLYENLIRLKGLSSEQSPGACAGLIGAHQVDQVLLVDQSPLARSPRSTPAVYIGVFDRVRELFAQVPDSIATGLSPAAFSFNSGPGRCERCAGLGFEKVEMQFLSDQYVRCVECAGKRYQPHILKVRLQGKSIDEVLDFTVTEAMAFFQKLEANQSITAPLDLLRRVGLGYLRLGQPVNVLSGGESQRLKLVGHLAEGGGGRTGDLLIFDEPTTGLHFDDIVALLEVFHQLVERGNSVLVIEHNVEVIQSADYLIDLGPEAGEQGGQVIAVGTPEEVAQSKTSRIAGFLRERLAGRRSDLSLKSNRIADSRPIEPAISVHGARQHNLKNLSVRIPREKIAVITGLSGSGKSSLAFDILFAEGQRRFLDSMSTYARQFVEQMERPEVDHVDGLPPSVAIEQRVTRGGGKSTVATVTEVYHFLRLLFAKLGTQYCPKCQVPVQKQSLATIQKSVVERLHDSSALLTAPVVKARKGFHREVAAWAEREGYASLIVDGSLYPASEFPSLERYREHSIEVVLAKLDPEEAVDLNGLLKSALRLGGGSAFLLLPRPPEIVAGPKANGRNAKKIGRPRFDKIVLSNEMSCPSCGTAFEELDPRLFSFNSPHGWCQTCSGFGYLLPFAAEEDRAQSVLEAELLAERRSDSIDQESVEICPDCAGTRLNPVARAVRLKGVRMETIVASSIREAALLLEKLKFASAEEPIASPILPEIAQRLSFMEQVGIDYLALNRSAKTLSGGEAQRIRLAAQLGSNLRGVLYVLDEPTIGLHPRDNEHLLATLKALKEKGNTLVVVEHDEETMRQADLIVDLGPGAGREGGQLVGIGSMKEIQSNPTSATGHYLKAPPGHPFSGARRALDGIHWIKLEGARANNLKNINVQIPIGRLTVITGISGSGKSTLMHSALLPAVQRGLRSSRSTPNRQPWSKISGLDMLENVYEVDQSPIGKTSRSIPGTYVKVFDEIRSLFAKLPESRIRGYSATRFSFNTDGGRCETCAGQGVIKLEMNFLPTSYLPCEACGGKRFNPQTLSVEYNGKSIGDVLEMTIAEAALFFGAQPRIYRALDLLEQTGLGYLQLGQPSPTLSGGEAQRLKLVNELRGGVSKALEDRIRRNRQQKSNLYLLEEPTIGLHMADVQLLVEVLQRLVDEGNTVVVIEHNLDVMAEADYIIDIGPEAGDAGGTVVVAGPPETIATDPVSRTAPFLKKILARTPPPPPLTLPLTT